MDPMNSPVKEGPRVESSPDAPRGTPRRSSSGNVNALLVLARYSNNCSASEHIDLSAYVLRQLGLSGWQSNQLQHMFDENIEDESCAAVLEIDVELVQRFREYLHRFEKSEKRIISPEEKTTLQELFARQITEGTCANITHIPVSSVKKLKEDQEEEEKKKGNRGWVRGALIGAASSIISAATTPTPSRKTSMAEEEQPVPSLELSGRQSNQLQQMFAKNIDDVSCAEILKTDVELVKEFRRSLKSGETQQKHNISKEERAQLKQMMDREMSLEACAKVLHMPIDVVKQFKEEENGTLTLRHRLGQGDFFGVAEYVARRSLLTAAHMQKKAMATVKDPSFKVTAASAATGSVVGGVAGGGAGTVVGGTLGGVIGVIPAFFTFGTSIPIGMAVGSGIGLCTGVAVGSSIGAATGGASGYYYRDSLRNMGASLLSKAPAITGCDSGTTSPAKSLEVWPDWKKNMNGNSKPVTVEVYGAGPN